MLFLLSLFMLLHVTLIKTSAHNTTNDLANGTLVTSVHLCTESGIKCAADCLTLLVCDKDNVVPIKTVFCPEKSLDRRYCSNNTCSSTLETCTIETTPVFQCSEIGRFPDPDDCTRYRECKDIGITSDYYQCPTGYNFNPQNEQCDRNAGCEMINCSLSLGHDQALTYKSNPRFYAFCFQSLSGRMEIAIYKCGANLIFSLTSNTCVYRCASAGVFRDITNCHAYFSCSGTVGYFKWTRLVCPPNEFFDGTKCVTELSPCSSELEHSSNHSHASNDTITVDTSDMDTISMPNDDRNNRDEETLSGDAN